MSESLGEATLQLTGDASGASKAIDDTRSQLGASIFIFRTAGYALQSIGQAALSGFSSASQAAGDFNASLVRTQNLTSITDFNINKVHDSLLKMATETGKTPQELADGFYYAASVLNNLNDAMTVTEQAAKGSAVGLGSVTDVTRTLTSIMNVYGLTASDVNHVMDTLIIMVKDGAGEAGAFAGAIGRIIPIAKVAGVSFQDVAAALATATRAGLSVDEATTAITRTLTELIGTTANTNKELMTLGFSQKQIDDAMQHLAATTTSMESRLNKYGIKGADASQVMKELETNTALAEATMRKHGLTTAQVTAVEQTHNQAVDALRANLEPYGLSLQDIDSVLKVYTRDQEEGRLALGKYGVSSQELRDTLKGPNGLYNALQLIEDRTKGNDAELRKIFPNIRGFIGILATAGTQGAEYKSILDEMNTSQNVLNNDFVRTSNTQAFAAQRAQASLDALKIKTGEALAPTLIAFLNALTPLLTGVGDFADKHPKAFEIITLGMFGLAAGVYALGSAAQAAAGFIAIARVIEWVGENAPKVALIATVFEGLGTAFEVAGAFLLGTGGAVIAIIAGIIIIGYLLITHWTQLSETVKGLGTLLGTFFVEIWGKVRDAVGGFFNTLGTNVHNKLNEAWNGITTWVTNVWNGIVNTIKTNVTNAINAVIGFITSIPSLLLKGLEAAFHFLGFLVGRVIRNSLAEAKYINQWFRDLPKNLAALITEGAVKLRQAFDAVKGFIIEKIKEAAKGVLDAFGTIVDGLHYFHDHFKEIMANVWNSIVDFVKGKLHDFLQAFLDGFGAVVTFVHSVFGGQIHDKIAEILEGVKQAIRDKLHDVLQTWLDIFGAIVTFLQNLGPQLMAIAKDLGGQFWQGLKDGLGIHSPSFAEQAFFAISKAAKSSVADVHDAIRSLNAATPSLTVNSRLAVATLSASGSPSGLAAALMSAQTGSNAPNRDLLTKMEKWLDKMANEDTNLSGLSVSQRLAR